MAAVALGEHIGLWHVRTSDVTDVRTLEAVQSLLTAEERRAHAAFVFERNRHEYLVTRGVERAVLSLCIGKDPALLAFTRNAYGRPELVPRSPVRFNLTNTVAMVACAVAVDRELGVDAEPLDRADVVIEVASTVFTRYERAMLESLSLPERRRRAVELWTLKEAYMKARGMGMSLPVQQFEVRYGPSGERALHFFEGIDDDPSRWALASRDIGDHLVSLCVERGHGASGDVDIALERADLTRVVGS